jgi:flagellar hook-length control protein FliK
LPVAAAEPKHQDRPTTSPRQQPGGGSTTPTPRPQTVRAVEPAAPARVEPHGMKAVPHAPTVAPAARPEPGPAALPAVQPQPQPVQAATQQAVAQPERPAPPETPVRAHAQLAQLADTARTVVRLAVREGAAQAHITLHPAELGQVEIRLRYHGGGVSAEVFADSQAAAQVLHGAAAELRRSLEAQGLVVHDLDVRAGAQERDRAHEHHGHGHGGRRRAHEFDLPDQTTIDTSTLPLPTGAVDVLA